MSVRLIWGLVTAALRTATHAFAQEDASKYPSRPIHIIVCVPAGGGVDTVTRFVAQGIEKKLGQPVVVENKAGAAGNIGAEYVFKAEPDGYTLLASQPAPITVNPLLYSHMAIDPSQFEPVAIMTEIANVLLVRPDFPAKNIQEFMADVKANPDKVNYASQGIGTTSHLSAAQFESLTGTKLVHVPYKGTAPALNDLISSHVDMIFMEFASAKKFADSGKARILAVATDKRLPELPDVPTLQEAGVKDFESGTWNAISAPPKTPMQIVDKLNKAIEEALASPEAKAHFAKLGLHPAHTTPTEAKAFIQNETKTWGQVIKEAGIKPH
jgi:tripartite-type tricarboxylate transporter receptor subunit TctC